MSGVGISKRVLPRCGSGEWYLVVPWCSFLTGMCRYGPHEKQRARDLNKMGGIGVRGVARNVRMMTKKYVCARGWVLIWW